MIIGSVIAGMMNENFLKNTIETIKINKICYKILLNSFFLECKKFIKNNGK